MKSSKLFLLILLLVGNVLTAVAQGSMSPKPNPTDTFISTSDIHFDPFYDPTIVTQLLATDHTGWEAIFRTSAITAISGDHHDSNYPLFISALEQMKAVQPHPHYMIVTGDFLAHHFTSTISSYTTDSATQSRFIAETIRFVAYMFSKYYPETIILPVLGNNDSYCGDYDMPMGNAFLKMFAQTWVPLQHNNDKMKDSSFVALFSKGGYYSYIPANEPAHEMIFLNTIFFSVNYNSSCTGMPLPSTQPGTTQLTWLDNELQKNAARGPKSRKVWIACHIPPGQDVYSSIKYGQTVMMWNSPFNSGFLNELDKYKNDIVANFAGHTHMDEFRVVYNTQKIPISFIHVTPSISRSNGNYPGFEVFNYRRSDFKLSNYTTYELNAGLPVPAWGLEYNFNQQYGVQGVTPGTYNTIRQKMATDTTTQNAYINYNYVGNTNNTSGMVSGWQSYWAGTGITITKK